MCNNAIENSLFFFLFDFAYTYVSWFLFVSFSFAPNVCTSFRIILTHCMSIDVSGSCWFLSSPWISVIMIGYMITHCTCICPFLDPCFSLSFSFSAYINVQLYCHWLYFYRYFSWFAFLPLFFPMSVSVYEYIRNSACIGTSLDSYFFLSHSVWMCLPVSGYSITLRRCIYTSLDPSFSFSLFLWRFLFGYNYWDWLYMYSYLSWSAFVSLSVCLSIRVYYR